MSINKDGILSHGAQCFWATVPNKWNNGFHGLPVIPKGFPATSEQAVYVYITLLPLDSVKAVHDKSWASQTWHLLVAGEALRDAGLIPPEMFNVFSKRAATKKRI